MAIILESLALEVLAVLITFFIGLYTYFQWSFKHWERKGIPYVKPRFPFGTVDLFSNTPLSLGETIKRNYDEFKAKGCKQVGIYIFSKPLYLAIDVEHIKNILSKDFDHFVDRGVYCNEKDDPLAVNLFSIEGAKWRKLRTKLTPTFTSAKMKLMFHTLVECGVQLNEAVGDMCLEKRPIDIKDVLARFTTNVIGSCAFGIECNCFKDPNAEFRKYGKRIFNITKFESFQIFLGFTAPDLARKLHFKATPYEVTEFFMNVVKETVRYREENNVVRKDVLQLLLEIKNDVKDDKGRGIGLTIEELAAQSFVFFAAGYETSSTTMTFCLFELTQNLAIQQKVREEINAVLARHNGEITYDALSEMKYVGQVIDETLRKYPPLMVLSRVCVKDYTIPGSNIKIDKGTTIAIPTLGLHLDPEYFPQPDKFDPDRFSDENRHFIKPCAYLPFGEGPRNCIGMRFGIMQTKVGLAVLLKNYKFTLNEKTRVPLEIDPLALVYTAKGDVWLNIERV